MYLLRPGQETVLAWNAGAVDCRVVASAGAYVLLALGRATGAEPPLGPGSLTYLDGMTPMGWDGEVEAGSVEHEVRFRIETGTVADRRSSVRLPVAMDVQITERGRITTGQAFDVSAGGMRFRHPGYQHDVGEELRVSAQLPDGPLLEALSVVRASEPAITSVEFTVMHAASAQDVGAWTVDRLRRALGGAGGGQVLR